MIPVTYRGKEGHVCDAFHRYLYEKDEKIIDIWRSMRFTFKIYLKTRSVMMSDNRDILWGKSVSQGQNFKYILVHFFKAWKWKVAFPHITVVMT